MATGIPRPRHSAASTPYGPSRQNSLSGAEIELVYRGKHPEAEILASPPAILTSLRHGSGQKDLMRRLYYADNLPVLASLLADTQVRGKVRLVYIDPPFATKSSFQSRSQREAYDDILSGSSYLEFLRQRLILLRELLADDGSIYVHLDENMAFQVKILMDEIFGEIHYRNWITRKKCNPKNYTRKTFGNISDYILFYTKTDNYVWNRPIDAWTPERASKEYEYTEESTGRAYKKVPIHAPGARNGATGQPWRGKLPPRQALAVPSERTG